jgi:hypothetical protein
VILLPFAWRVKRGTDCVYRWLRHWFCERHTRTLCITISSFLELEPFFVGSFFLPFGVRPLTLVFLWLRLLLQPSYEPLCIEFIVFFFALPPLHTASHENTPWAGLWINFPIIFLYINQPIFLDGNEIWWMVISHVQVSSCKGYAGATCFQKARGCPHWVLCRIRFLSFLDSSSTSQNIDGSTHEKMKPWLKEMMNGEHFPPCPYPFRSLSFDVCFIW